MSSTDSEESMTKKNKGSKTMDSSENLDSSDTKDKGSDIKKENEEGSDTMEENDSETMEDKGSGTKKDKGSGTTEENSDDETVSVITRRFLRWTSEDLFDFNPGYAKSLRGILNIVQIIVDMIVMTLVGAVCQYPQSMDTTFFYCHSSAAFIFVIACSACIHSVLLLACCLLSKKGDRIIQMTPLEVLYYIMYSIFFCIASLALELNVNSKDDGYHAIMAGGVFGITNSILYLMSAIWFFVFHQMRGKGDERRRRRSRSRRRSNNSD